MSDILIVLIDGAHAGELRLTRTGTLEFVYDDTYLEGTPTPLSTSMPVSTVRHLNRVVRPFIANLLPDNEDVRVRWGREFGVAPTNDFALLGYVGEECAGAIQLVRPERLDDLASGSVIWLDEATVGAKLRELRADPSAWLWRDIDERGRFSLSGAQAKTALRRSDDGRWGRPIGNEPTTHILKVLAGYHDQEIVEHVTMRAAANLGLPTATSEIRTFDGERAIVLTRYDRIEASGRLRRVHQEDLCQALSLMPSRKYQSDGGPGPAEVIRLLRARLATERADAAVDRFTDALIFNVLLGGTDAHAKNYSLLLNRADVDLAPLYDLTSGLPYLDQMLARSDGARVPQKERERGLPMAMTVGGENRIGRVTASTWKNFARSAGLSADLVLDRVRDLTDRVVAATVDAADGARIYGDTKLLDQLVTGLERQVESVRRLTFGVGRGTVSPQPGVGTIESLLAQESGAVPRPSLAAGLSSPAALQPLPPVTCTGHFLSGKPCTYQPLPGSDRCGFHPHR